MSKRNVVHIEIPAANVKAAGSFYEELFGWKMQHAAEFNYTMWADGSGAGGGFNEVSAENPAGEVLIYMVGVAFETELKNAVRLGGKIVRAKTEIPETGWFGIFEDPTGNKLALYTSMNPR